MMPFFIAWLLMALDDRGVGSHEEVWNFAFISSSLLALFFYVIPLVIRIRWAPRIVTLGTEGWFMLLAALIWGVLGWYLGYCSMKEG